MMKIAPRPTEVAATHPTQSFLLAGAVLATGIALYMPVLRNPFIQYDDPLYITQNVQVQAGLRWETIMWSLRTFHAGNWHPLTWLAHALIFQIFGSQAAGHHFASVLLHALNAAVLFLCLEHWARARWRSLAVAALFLVHPLNVESVAWAAELKTVLSASFFFLALAAYFRYTEKPTPRRYALLALLFVCGLASKPMVITLPFVLLLMDFWPLRRVERWSQACPNMTARRAPFGTLVLEKVPLLVLCGASGIVTIVAQRTTESVVPVGGLAGGPLSSVASIGAFLRLQNVLISYMAYLWKAVWPFGLAPFYPFHFQSRPAWQLLLSFFFLLSVTILAWKIRFERPWFGVGWLWYLGTLVPMIGIVQVGGQAMADRYAYLPLIGIFVIVVWGVADVFESRGFKQAALVPAVSAIVLLAFSSWRQESYWKSDYDLWSHTLAVVGDNPVAEHNIGIDLMQRNHLEEAEVHLRNSVRIDPGDFVSRVNLAVALQDQGRYSEAISEYAIAIGQITDPQILSTAYENLGNVYYATGDYSKADQSYRRALQINPQRQSSIVKLKELNATREINSFARSVSAHPTAEGYLKLGNMLSDANWIPEARDSYQKALKLDPALQDARNALNALPMDEN